MEDKKSKAIDDYISGFPGIIQEKLAGIRQVIREAAPDAKEVISYQMPAFKLNNQVLVYFAVAKSHIGFYPTPSGIEAFKDELAGYETSKGTVKFPLDKEIPFDLIGKITKFRVAEVTGNR